MALSLAVPAGSIPSESPDSPRRFKIYTEVGGVHRISYDELAGAGLRGPVDEPFALFHRGEAVPIWRRDIDGRFGPGDDILFLAEQLSGEHSYFHDHSRYNVYFLAIGRAATTIEPLSPIPHVGPEAATIRPLGRTHLERDRLLMRFQHDAEGDAWFWARLTHIDPRPFQLPLDLVDLDPRNPVTVRIGLRGWSTPFRRHDPPLPDHVVELLLDGRPIASTTWQAQQEHVLETRIDPASVPPGKHRLEVRIPSRVPDGATDPLVDVVLLNWIEMEYQRRGRVAGDRQEVLSVPAAAGGGDLVLRTAAPHRLMAFTERAIHRAVVTAGGTIHRFTLPDSFSGPLTIVPDESYLEAAAVLVDRVSTLRSEARQADYLIVTHPELAAAVAPLTDLHRRRGLVVELVDVFDIYDEFNHGIPHPRAIRDFVSFARHSWRRPAPRFVLLVGDASWDIKNTRPNRSHYADWTYLPGEVRRSRSNQMTPYDEDTPRDRNLVPTWSYPGAQGHAASDNYFVAVEGDDPLPDLAIGRFAVVTPEEVAAIVEKTIRYFESPPTGEWLRTALLISNESAGFQLISDRIGRPLERHGFEIERIYPLPEEEDNSRHQARLLDAFARGQSLIHFLGHGGRYIWRTGPPDFRKNHDLFTLDHLDRLEPSERLPVVLSMTCYSAPFDHPTADSIGEKFVRLADRGAIAVVAASWRVTPTEAFSTEILQGLLRGETIGEALMHAKRTVGRRDLIEVFNLLGDPAVGLPSPRALARRP